jgi:hypothetical protein
MLPTLKKAPCFVPWDCRNAPAIDVMIQYDWAARFLAIHDP